MDYSSGQWPSERVRNLAGKFLQVALEKKLNYPISLERATFLIKYRKLHDNLRLIHKLGQTTVAVNGVPLEGQYEQERIFREAGAIITGEPIRGIRKEITQKAKEEQELKEQKRQEEITLSNRTERYLGLCSAYGIFINDISDLHKKRLSVLSHRVKDEEKLSRAKEELEKLFCDAINKAIEYCVSNL